MRLASPSGSMLTTMSSYRHTASWAVWGAVAPEEPFTSASDLGFPVDDPDLPSALHGNVVMVALNPGNAAATWTPDDAWVNFHGGARHNDHLLAEAFRGTPAWGGYLADLHPTIVESNSTLVTPRAELVADAVRSLAEQILLLGNRDPQIVCIGRGSHTRLADHLQLLRDALGNPDLDLVCIPHYSGANNGVHGGDPARYRALVAAILDEPLRRWHD